MKKVKNFYQKIQLFQDRLNNLREGASSLGLDIVRPDSSGEYCLNPESN